jgi:hypothetical protein
VAGSCVHGKEPSVSIIFCEIPEELNDWRLLKKGSPPVSEPCPVYKSCSPSVACMESILETANRYNSVGFR